MSPHIRDQARIGRSPVLYHGAEEIEEAGSFRMRKCHLGFKFGTGSVQVRVSDAFVPARVQVRGGNVRPSMVQVCGGNVRPSMASGIDGQGSCDGHRHVRVRGAQSLVRVRVRGGACLENSMLRRKNSPITAGRLGM